MGLEAVVLFFVLSGFLVGGKVLERIVNGSFDLKAYTLDRVSRIYIPLIPALIFTAVVNCLICGRPFSVLSLVGNLFGLQGVWSQIPAFAGNDPLWTLSYECWFYVLGGLVAIICAGGGASETHGALWRHGGICHFHTAPCVFVVLLVFGGFWLPAHCRQTPDRLVAFDWQPIGRSGRRLFSIYFSASELLRVILFIRPCRPSHIEPWFGGGAALSGETKTGFEPGDFP